ncbi:Ff.00g103550.m01.CDS01 [Fusarium sp. VM40]|nr:Ff.00g103550.m01.CDS01 [Fusarium sp. VM40]
MVSTLEPPTASSVSRRGPSSIVSRQSQSHSRSKRYNRSHTGGTSHGLQNEFPVFSSGDVEIVVRARETPRDAAPTQNRYLLHRHTLTRSSGFFEVSTSNQWSRARALPAGNELSRIGEDGEPSPINGSEVSSSSQRGSTHPPRKKWRYELDPRSGPNDIPMLVQRDESSRDTTQSLFGPASAPPTVSSRDSRSSQSRSKHSHSHSRSLSNSSTPSGFFRSVANLSLSSNHPPPAPELSQADEDLLRDYDNLFRIFYNYPPVLDSVNVADAYVQCKSLLNLADQYDALAVVGPRVDHHMLQFQSRLWKQIAKYPISYLRLGYLARSRVIFQEALIHVVGQWPAGERSLRAALPDIVLDIIEDKVEELEETVGRIEGRLFRLGLTNSRGERVGPSNNYLDWLSISLFRQWLADNTSPQPPPDQRRRTTSRDGGRSVAALPPAAPPLNSVGRAYRQLGSNNPTSFLGHDDCKRFLKLTPELYSRENLRRFEKRLDELKTMAREIVRPLMGSNLELDMGGTSRTPDSITYLTCTTVVNRDLPWVMEDQAAVGLVAN